MTIIRAAEDIAEIDKALQTLRYERWAMPHVSGCEAGRGRPKSGCEQCRDTRCLLCKTHMPGNQSGAQGCIICDLKGGTNFEPCPT